MLDSLLRIAREAGEISLRYFGNLKQDQISCKSEEADMLTVADKEVEDYLRQELNSHFPNVAFIGEESFTGKEEECSESFIVDPIDGTTNFIHNLPAYAVSIAFQSAGHTEIGVVYCPFLNNMYYAERGKGAYKDDARIQVSATDSLINALASSGFACVRERKKPDNMEIFRKTIYQLRGIRISGSAAYDCCTVAEGMTDIYWEYNLKTWDVAAGALIVEEAGGKVTDLSGNEDYDPSKSFVATNSTLHQAFLSAAGCNTTV